MTNKKYIVRSGEIISKSDGQKHFISYKQLMQLYRVNPDDCICLIIGNELTGRKDRDFLNSLLLLTPRFDGEYKLENCKPYGLRK